MNIYIKKLVYGFTLKSNLIIKYVNIYYLNLYIKFNILLLGSNFWLLYLLDFVVSEFVNVIYVCY